MSLYDITCLQRSVAVRAVFKLWKKGAWKELDELGLGRDIQRGFEDASDYLPGAYPRSDQQAEVFLAALPDALRERVVFAADLLTMSYSHIFQDEIRQDSYLKESNNGRQRAQSQEPRARKRGRSRRRPV